MLTLELTLQHPRAGVYPVSAELRLPGELSQRREAGFALDPDIQAELLERQLDPETYGATLDRLVFRDGVRDLLMQARVQGCELHLLLVVEADDLRPLRWERLALPAGGEWRPAALEAAVSFSRYLPSLAERRFPLIGKPDLRAYVVLIDKLVRNFVCGRNPFLPRSRRLLPFDKLRASDKPGTSTDAAQPLPPRRKTDA